MDNFVGIVGADWDYSPFFVGIVAPGCSAYAHELQPALLYTEPPVMTTQPL